MNSSQPGRTPSGKTHNDAAAPARVRHVDSQQDGGDENATRLPRADAPRPRRARPVERRRVVHAGPDVGRAAPQLHPDVVWRWVDDEAVLVNVKTNRIYSLNPTGARLWELIGLERGLVAYRYLSRAGASPELVVGVAKEMQGVHGHVWVTVDGRAVHDSPSTLAGFEPIFVVKSDGTLIGTPPSSVRSLDGH
jgi:Transglutaminase-like superfamily/Coenzyme PQQ synthesis protein D (PqqD)